VLKKGNFLVIVGRLPYWHLVGCFNPRFVELIVLVLKLGGTHYHQLLQQPKLAVCSLPGCQAGLTAGVSTNYQRACGAAAIILSPYRQFYSYLM
jgi:hypothetical protein